MAYGGRWTLIKLEVLEKYLGFYVTALKDKFKLCYIDAFAGQGEFEVKNIGITTGSALRAMDYNFNQYIFIEKEIENIRKLAEAVVLKGISNVTVVRGDGNRLLAAIDSFNWYINKWRGVIFLDPYAMQLNWDSLKHIAETKAFDVWYLFPISALVRNLRIDGKIDPSNKEAITRLLGTDEWEDEIYSDSPQMGLFDDPTEKIRMNIDRLSKYIVKRLETVFPAVAQKPLKLINPKNNSPLFLLCFAVSNPSPQAIRLSLKAADHILTHTY